MKISHQDALSIEHICRRALGGEETGALGGLVDALVFETESYLAVPIVLTAKRHMLGKTEMDEYLIEIDKAYKSSNFNKYEKLLREVANK